jgi:hypothetical protein
VLVAGAAGKIGWSNIQLFEVLIAGEAHFAINCTPTRWWT